MIDMEYIRGFYPPYIAQNANFQKHQKGIANKKQLSAALGEMVAKTDMKMKQRDFEHLLFDSHKSEMILRFIETYESIID